MISVGPFIINTILGMVIVFPAAVELFCLEVPNSPLAALLGWLRISSLMHAFPSTGDARVRGHSILKNPEVPPGQAGYGTGNRSDLLRCSGLHVLARSDLCGLYGNDTAAACGFAMVGAVFSLQFGSSVIDGLNL